MKIRFLEHFTQNTIKSLLLNIVAIGILFTIIILLFFYVYLPAHTNKGETITVPNLEGIQYDELDDFLGKRHLRYEVSDSAYSSVYPPLTVLKQYPKSGANVKENRVIYLTIKAKEPRKVEMPKLTDGSLKNAELILKSYGLRRGEITYKPHPHQNRILEQRYNDEIIKPGDPVPKGAVIDFVVGDGLGNRRFEISNYLGRQFEDVKFAITGQGLNLGSVVIEVVGEDAYVPVSMVDMDADSLLIEESGTVVKQNPDPGTTVRLGDLVDVWVAALNEEDSTMLVDQLNGTIDGDQEEVDLYEQ